MALSAGSVTIGLGVDYGSLTRDLYKANATLGRFAAGLPKLLSNPLVIAGSAVTGAFTAMQSEMARATQTSVLAKSLGSTSGDVLALQLAGQKAGVELEKLNATMAKVAVTVSQAAVGMGEGGEALKRLGLDAKTLSSFSVDEQIRQIGAALDRLPDQGERAAISMKLFGESGVKASAAIISAANSMEKMNDATTFAVEELAKLGRQFQTTTTAGTQLAGSIALIGNTLIELGSGRDVALFDLLFGTTATREKTAAEVSGMVRASAERFKQSQDEMTASAKKAADEQIKVQAYIEKAEAETQARREKNAAFIEGMTSKFKTPLERLSEDISRAEQLQTFPAETLHRMRAERLQLAVKESVTAPESVMGGAAIINTAQISASALAQNATLAIAAQSLNEQKKQTAILERMAGRDNAAIIGGAYQ